MINSRQKWLALGHINMVPASPLWRPPSQLSSTSLRREAALASTPQRTSSWSFAALWKSEALKNLYQHPFASATTHVWLPNNLWYNERRYILTLFPSSRKWFSVLTGLCQQDPQHFSLTRATKTEENEPGERAGQVLACPQVSSKMASKPTKSPHWNGTITEL